MGWLGGHPVEEPYSSLSTYCTIFYFIFFLFFIPLIELIEREIYLDIKKNNVEE